MDLLDDLEEEETPTHFEKIINNIKFKLNKLFFSFIKTIFKFIFVNNLK